MSVPASSARHPPDGPRFRAVQGLSRPRRSCHTPAMAAVQLPRVAWRRVLPVLAVLAALLEATAGRYGYHRDELYFLVASHHPAWGYADQPPLVPVLIRLETAVLGDSVRALRTLPLLLAL